MTRERPYSPPVFILFITVKPWAKCNVIFIKWWLKYKLSVFFKVFSRVYESQKKQKSLISMWSKALIRNEKPCKWEWKV